MASTWFGRRIGANDPPTQDDAERAAIVIWRLGVGAFCALILAGIVALLRSLVGSGR